MAKTDTHVPAPAPAQSQTPTFDAMIEEARRAPRETDISLEELDRRLAITDEERRAAQPTIDRWLREDAEDAEKAEEEGSPPSNETSEVSCPSGGRSAWVTTARSTLT